MSCKDSSSTIVEEFGCDENKTIKIQNKTTTSKPNKSKRKPIRRGYSSPLIRDLLSESNIRVNLKDTLQSSPPLALPNNDFYSKMLNENNTKESDNLTTKNNINQPSKKTILKTTPHSPVFLKDHSPKPTTENQSKLQSNINNDNHNSDVQLLMQYMSLLDDKQLKQLECFIDKLYIGNQTTLDLETYSHTNKIDYYCLIQQQQQQISNIDSKTTFSPQQTKIISEDEIDKLLSQNIIQSLNSNSPIIHSTTRVASFAKSAQDQSKNKHCRATRTSSLPPLPPNILKSNRTEKEKNNNSYINLQKDELLEPLLSLHTNSFGHINLHLSNLNSTIRPQI
ncbi:hypothetical protein PPL_05274 [Heterostelium album PN500]|uniref:Uncharacterized protein n=1 Tax=Heterostelium pallidum (strain ATCC 26659 / Pp 5 / PN500) TaxID=670386 RepID=D3BB88_HETP5|nr:hypothetical protein PPL_05274 [Heterostelium album PN500]EFA81295.1 hypothetical protein PPL_05274 [Heterostelium album PN500]|eukprot:XP_020433413.1 hypothetical protein PPL_05274 [Heterostelium album PN500]